MNLIFGAYGLSEEYEIGRLLLEAKALELEGTSELHTSLIAEYAPGIRGGETAWDNRRRGLAVAMRCGSSIYRTHNAVGSA